MALDSKYLAILERLVSKPAFTAVEAVELGIPRHALAYFEKKGVVGRLSRGVYVCSKRRIELIEEDLALAAYTTKNAVICLISALNFYNITDQIPREHWLAIPHSQRAPVRDSVRVVRMRNIELGCTTVQIGAYKLRIFDRERCIVDAFRYLSLEIALNALRSYLADKGYKPKLKRLQEYAKELRVNLKPYILFLTLC